MKHHCICATIAFLSLYTFEHLSKSPSNVNHGLTDNDCHYQMTVIEVAARIKPSTVFIPSDNERLTQENCAAAVNGRLWLN